jgi:hypothetical protein
MNTPLGGKRSERRKLADNRIVTVRRQWLVMNLASQMHAHTAMLCHEPYPCKHFIAARTTMGLDEHYQPLN